jgi:hypothetical protein
VPQAQLEPLTGEWLDLDGLEAPRGVLRQGFDSGDQRRKNEAERECGTTRSRRQP